MIRGWAVAKHSKYICFETAPFQLVFIDWQEELMKNTTNKRTLKKRIYRMTTQLNFNSLLVMFIAMTLALGVALNLFSNIISEGVGEQMGTKLRNDWRTAIVEGKVPQKYKTLNKEYIKLFEELGSYFKFCQAGPINTNINPDIDFKNIKKTNMNSIKDITIPAVKEITSPNKVTIIKDTAINLFPNLLAIEYKVWKDNKLLYDSSKGQNHSLSNRIPGNDTWLMRFLNTTSTMIILNDDGTELAKLEVRLNPDLVLAGYIGLITICIIIFLITLLLSRIGAGVLSAVVVKPLEDLDAKMKQLANGNLEAAMNSEIVLKKPIKEVESLANSSNMIMSRMHDYINTLGNQKLELEAQNLDLQDNSRSLEVMNQTLAQKNSKLKNILDNVEQGFFTFKQDLTIHSEYSLICDKIFSDYIYGKTLSSILFPDNSNMQSFMNELLTKIFNSNESERKKYIPLLPEEAAMNNCIINISYKVVRDEINEESIMVIITDITEKRLLEKKMDEERKTLKMVVKSIVNRLDFLDLVKEFEEFISVKHDKVSEEEYEHLLRQIHTFKGNFSQYDMVNLVPKLNELEDKLYEKGAEFDLSDIDYTELQAWLKEDLDIITSYAGSDFMKDREYCYIKKEKLIEIENKIQETLSQKGCKIILPLIKNLRYKSVKDLLRTYPGYVMKLSERLGKSIKPIEITGDEILVDPNYYSKVIKSLSHIFRNCVDHGIETEDERLELGKEQFGNILCDIKDNGDSFQIIISDDGRGINLEAIQEKAINKGLYTKDEWDGMTTIQKYDMIFKQGITTKEKANFISGRGVGMSAVKECILEIGGDIQVNSTPLVGTVFTISLPKQKEVICNQVSPMEFMEALINNSKEIIFNNTENNFNPENIMHNNAIVLNNITTLIKVTGAINSVILIGVNRELAKRLTKGFIIEEIDENEMILYAEDVLGEISNTIIGNAFGSFEDAKGNFHLGLPIVLTNNVAYVKFNQSEFLNCNLVYKDYKFSISMLLVDNDISVDCIKEGF